MEVPEPRTVSRSAVSLMIRKNLRAQSAVPGDERRSGARFRLGLHSLGGDRLRDLQIGHLELAEEVEQEAVFLRRKPTRGLLAEGVQHVDELPGCFGIDDRLPSARVGVGTQDHCCVAAQHANEVFECGRMLGRWFGCLGGCRRGLWGRGRRGRRIIPRIALLLGDVLAKLAFGIEQATINDAKAFFRFLFGQEFPSKRLLS